MAAESKAQIAGSAWGKQADDGPSRGDGRISALAFARMRDPDVTSRTELRLFLPSLLCNQCMHDDRICGSVPTRAILSSHAEQQRL